MRQTSKILSMLLAVAMLLPSQALAADGALEDAASKSTVVINEVESDAPNNGNDWVEIANIGSEAVNISGWYLTDDKGEEQKTEGQTTPLAGETVLEPGAFLVLEKTVNFDFGLGKADTAILYDGNGKQVDSYAYTSVAAGTWSRQADGSFADAEATKGRGKRSACRAGTESPRCKGSVGAQRDQLQPR